MTTEAICNDLSNVSDPRSSTVPEGGFARPETSGDLLDMAFLGHEILVAASGHVPITSDASDVLLKIRKELNAIAGWLIGGKWAGGADTRISHHDSSPEEVPDPDDEPYWSDSDTAREMWRGKGAQ